MFLSDLSPARFGVEGFLSHSRERQERRGGGADDDLKFPFHIFIFFRVMFFFSFVQSFLSLATCTVGGEAQGFYGVLPYQGFLNPSAGLLRSDRDSPPSLDLPTVSLPLVVARIS